MRPTVVIGLFSATSVVAVDVTAVVCYLRLAVTVLFPVASESRISPSVVAGLELWYSVYVPADFCSLSKGYS